MAGLVKERDEIQRPESPEEQKHSKHEAEIANAIDDEGFFAGVSGGFFQEVEADEKVTRKADTFPADEEENVIRGHDQDEHEEHEQIEVGEEAVIAAFVGHVTHRIDVDEPAHASDHHEHDDSELVDLEIEARAEAACGDPGKVLLHPGNLFWGELPEFADGFERGGKGEASRADGDGVDDFVRPLGAEEAVGGGAKQRQKRNDPEIIEYGMRRH